MKLLKKNLAVKIAAFVLLQIFLTATVLSGIVVIFNADMGWYSAEKSQVQEDILQQMAFNVNNQISSSLWEDPSRITESKTELIYGEKEAVGFGYAVSQLDEKGKKVIREVSGDLAKREDVYQETDEHDEYEITVYLLKAEPEEAAKTAYMFPPELRGEYNLYNKTYTCRQNAIALGCACLAASLVLFIFLMAAAGYGRKEEREGLKKVPLDLLAAAGGVLAAILCIILETNWGFWHLYESYDAVVLAVVGVAMGITIIVTGFFTIFSVRVKMGSWWKSTVIYQALKILKRLGKWLWSGLKTGAGGFARQLPLIWKTLGCLILFFLINLATCVNMYYSGAACFLWLLEAAAVSAGVLYITLLLKRLKEGGKRLAEGNLEYQIDKKGMFLELREHAENLNSIGKGMAAAVEEKTKSERFKAELITNVSHDIKTPLTSIINYVDFLKKEDIRDETIKEYVEVLDRQSRKLKKLTEDLIDASKASTGNIKIDLAPCQVGVLMTQVMGEYKEKAEKNDLKFVMKLPEEELEILADGRRLWRVFDNLLNNICKYSQPGTRVYMELKKVEDKAVIIYRNTSRYELNITEEELMERFVRGDSSRHTEGSGLGLSIARNLTQLQGGTFDIYIDGDLFKVTVSFDLISL